MAAFAGADVRFFDGVACLMIKWINNGGSGDIYVSGDLVLKVCRVPEGEAGGDVPLKGLVEAYNREAELLRDVQSLSRPSLLVPFFVGNWKSISEMEEQMQVKVLGLDEEKSNHTCPVIVMERLFPAEGTPGLVRIRLGVRETASQASAGWKEVADVDDLAGGFGFFMKRMNLDLKRDGADIEMHKASGGNYVLDFGACSSFVDAETTANAWQGGTTFPCPKEQEVWDPFTTTFDHPALHKVLEFFKEGWDKYH